MSQRPGSLALLAAALLLAPLALAGACTPKAADTSPSAPPAGAMEHDPSATPQVAPLDFGGKAPDDAEVQGTFQLAFGWTDRYGRSAIVIGKTESTSGDATTSMLVADYLLWEGSAWTLQRRFKERLEACQFDTELTAFAGPWSVTDLDRDGLGEATFAWRSGCRSDVSPVVHKVLVVRANPAGGEPDKFVLRGQTRVDTGGGIVVGGEYEADPAFAKAPPAALEHAKKVWGLTATETMR